MEHQKSYVWFPRLSGVSMATSLSGGTRSICFLITKFSKFSKVRSELIFEKYPQNTSKYQISAKLIRGFGI